MGELSFLLTNYSIEQLFLVIIVALIAFKVLLELFRYFYGRAKEYFGVQNKRETWESSTSEDLKNINGKLDALDQAAKDRKERLVAVENKIDTLEDYSKTTHKQQKELDSKMKLVQERLQENTRSFLIDAHHRFCYDVEGIDDQSLQSIERRYLYYKTAGGDSFIDELMKDIRALPRINYATYKNGLQPNDGREIHG